MANKWVDGDSARQMTNKYNLAAEEINSLKTDTERINSTTQQALDELNQEMDTHTAEYKTFKSATNTSIEDIESEMITSEQASSLDSLSPPIGILAELSVVGKRIVMNTDTGTMSKTISSYIENNRLVFITSE